jgi:leucyl/phenylalanyl-tRNA--protein transferase
MFYLSKQHKFPSLRNRNDSGVIAYGGEMTSQRLLEAYSKGIFPWYSYDTPILWHSPHERCIFGIDDFKVSHSLRQKLKHNTFSFTIDQRFVKVIRHCAEIKRNGETGTWILPELMQATFELHKMGYAHSVEVWQKSVLVGGLYGVAIGKAFFGESMYHKVTDASKAALYFLFTFLKEQGFHFVDAQMHTHHLESLGAKVISRNEYLDLLKVAIKHKTIKENWDEFIKKSGTKREFYGRNIPLSGDEPDRS